jgi:hypothetical protein
MLNIKNFIRAGIISLVAMSGTLVLGINSASAMACYQYNQNGFTTSTTPVFDNICGITGGTTEDLTSTSGNYPLGDETNFVRIRDHGSDNPLGSANPTLTDSETSDCAAGSEYDIWTYVHNDASADYNNLDANGNPVTPGTGSAVAKNVQLTTSAPTSKAANSFTFSSTISADNAASATDTTTLNCNGAPVTLSVTAASINNNISNSTTYSALPTSDINSTFGIGSPNMPGAGQQGQELGCWNYRMVIVYTVKVTPVPTPAPSTAACTLLNVLANSDRTVTINNFQETLNNAEFKNAVINWGDNSADTTITDSTKVQGTTHTYANYGTYQIYATVSYTDNSGNALPTSGGAGSTCAQTVTYKQNVTPVVTTASTTPTATTLVNTGPGSVVGIFAAVAAVSAVAYRYLLGRKLSK